MVFTPLSNENPTNLFETSKYKCGATQPVYVYQRVSEYTYYGARQIA